MGSARWSHILVLEDDSATSHRRQLTAVGGRLSDRVTVRLHEIRNGQQVLLAERSYRAGTMVKRGRGAKTALALRLIDQNRPRRGAIVVSGTTYGGNSEFLSGLIERGLPFVTEVRASALVAENSRHTKRLSRGKIEQMLCSASWRSIELTSPTTGRAVQFSATFLPGAAPHQAVQGQLFAAQTGGMAGIHRGTIIGFASAIEEDLEELVRAVVWARWIRAALRRGGRAKSSSARATSTASVQEGNLTVRANIALADRQDDRPNDLDVEEPRLRGVLGGERNILNVVELFAGAGGMGLGFLLASAKRGYRIIFSGEVNPIYAATLRHNYAHIAERIDDAHRVPAETEPVDLRTPEALAQVTDRARRAGGVDIVIGGPPCQGFSNANRNSWSRANPNNKLVDVFVTYVEALSPPIFMMENVQGILWTSKAGRSDGISVVDHLAKRMKRAGYAVFPRLLDAVWYGVPQYRSRFFLVGIHRDLGYRNEDFGAWGPFPWPTHGLATGRSHVTVNAAIRDLPPLRNGGGTTQAAYNELTDHQRRINPFLAFVRSGAPRGMIYDHVTSRHADYVIERYRHIPPGGNWEAIVDIMSNYADVARTHSNIYRRLTLDQPAITIGHYRKSMLVHPRQHRGLSLREASRLQSFPDWFRFAGRTDGGDGGLVHKQQQLANAVCPLVSKATAEFLLRI